MDGSGLVTTLEDKLVQRALVTVLNCIYEADFLGFSYGFRPGREPHYALDALCFGIERKKVNWVTMTMPLVYRVRAALLRLRVQR
jgi:retron-type reverse transcriptase